MLSDEIAFAIAQFFDRIGPSHDEIRLLVARAGFAHLDPYRVGDPNSPGKMKRVRAILVRAAEGSRSADSLVEAFVRALRSHGSFDRASEHFPGEAKFVALRNAFRSQGWELSSDGRLGRVSLGALDGVALTDALNVYADRSLRGWEDVGLLIGNGKDFVEAVARHAIEVSSGSPATSPNFDTTLWQAFDRLGLATPTPSALATLDQDPGRMLEQATWLLAVAQKRLRNQMGSGHGRSQLPAASLNRARFAGQAAGLVARLLLDEVQELVAPKVA